MTPEQPITPITVETATITCDGTFEGKGAASGHPRVALNIDTESGEARCPYCSQTFRLNPDAPLAGGH